MRCKCNRAEAGVNGTCEFCVRESADLFWDLVDDRITVAAFHRRLRKIGRYRNNPDTPDVVPSSR